MPLGSIIKQHVKQNVAVADEGAEAGREVGGGGGGEEEVQVVKVQQIIDLTDDIDIETEQKNMVQVLLPNLHEFQGEGSTPTSQAALPPTSNPRKRGLSQLTTTTTTETLRQSSYNPSSAFTPLLQHSPRKRRRLSRDYNHNNKQSDLVSYIYIYRHRYMFTYIYT